MEMGVEGRVHFHESSGKSTRGSPGKKAGGRGLATVYLPQSLSRFYWGRLEWHVRRESQTFRPHTTWFLDKGVWGEGITRRSLVLEAGGEYCRG